MSQSGFYNNSQALLPGGYWEGVSAYSDNFPYISRSPDPIMPDIFYVAPDGTRYKLIDGIPTAVSRGAAKNATHEAEVRRLMKATK
jgi:hypothetical protein